MNRGVAYWENGDDQRLFYTAGRRIWCVNAATGRPVPTFGTGGMDRSRHRHRSRRVAHAARRHEPRRDLPGPAHPGHARERGRGRRARATCARSTCAPGQLRWTFHTIPRAGEPGAETWAASALPTAGGANSWPGMSRGRDARHRLRPHRLGVARLLRRRAAGAEPLRQHAARARRRDGPARLALPDRASRRLGSRSPRAPNLVRVTRDGRRVDAVAQITKSGFVFLFDREIRSPAVPDRGAAGARVRSRGRADVADAADPDEAGAVRAPAHDGSGRHRRSRPSAHDGGARAVPPLRHGDLFTPPSREGTIVLPGFDGGGEWGGAAVDRETGVLYVNASDVPWIAAMRERAQPRRSRQRPAPGEQLYAASCASCHRRRPAGRRRPHALARRCRATRRTATEIQQVIERGKRLHARVRRRSRRRRRTRSSRISRGRARRRPRRHGARRTDDPRRRRAARRRRASSSSATSAGATRTAIRRSSRRGAR